MPASADPPLFPCPDLLVSRCLGLDTCRYDGQFQDNALVAGLRPHVRLLPVCPETACGLPTPRPPIWCCQVGKKMVIYQPETGRDLTDQLQQAIDAILAAHPDIDGAILKSRSPSCGLYDTKIYSGLDLEEATTRGAGLFGQQLLHRFPDQAIEDEARLLDPVVREHFLLRLFTLARFRLATRQENPDSAAHAFHATHHLLLAAWNPARCHRAATFTTDQQKLAGERLVSYRDELGRLLAAPPHRPGIAAALLHCLAPLTRRLDAQSSLAIRQAIDSYRSGRTSLHTPGRLLEAAARNANLCAPAEQMLFHPYPRALAADATDADNADDPADRA
ncbi:MAG: DUF523 and DUF1722 domain-containing protein [Desulfobulbus sp.]|jgi:uncharacterized protein YbbK (DUF523 family)/uncharacterized protein YbgA (DUF1722 family)